MKLANSSGNNGSIWHIYKHKEKNEKSLCDKKKIKRVGTRRWLRLDNETSDEAKNKVKNKIGSVCKDCLREVDN